MGAQGGVVILAVTLTRAPLLVPLTAMQGNLIAHFVDERTNRLRALIAPAAIVGGIGAVGVLAAGLVGPWLLRVGFGPQYHASSALLAWLTAAAVAIAMLTLTGAATVAAALHRAYSLGWVGATVASGCCCCCRCRWRPAPWSPCCAVRWWESASIWWRWRAPGGRRAASGL